jgi:tight adherence protein B
MVGSLTPFAIVLGGAIAAAFLFSSLWQQIVGRLRGLGSFYARDPDLADLAVKSQDLGFVVITISAVAWIVLVIVVRPSVVVGAIYLPMVLGFTIYGTKVFLRLRIDRRVKAFRGQLEGVLRSLASGVRVGLGLRQALLMVAEQSKDPARKELTRVIGSANLGASLFDALDEMGRRLPLAETQMLARVMRVQANSGGDLGEVLEGLAETIRDRRRLERKISALVSQSKATAWLLGLLPLLLCAFLFLTQPMLRTAMLTTNIGRSSTFLGLALDAAAVFLLLRLTKLDL